MKQTFEFESEGVQFTVQYSGPANVTAGYGVIARRGNETERGRVSYARLSREGAAVNGLDFFNAGRWLSDLFGQAHWVDEDGEPLRAYTTCVPTPPDFTEWLVTDYAIRLDYAISELIAGREPGHYRSLWFYELSNEAELDSWDNPTPAQLLAALGPARKRREACRREAEAEAQEENAFRAHGGHIVGLHRCWECGMTKIIGEVTTEQGVEKMPFALWKEAEAARRMGHRRSAEKVPTSVLLSSAGFQPEGEQFRWVVVDTHYCGC